MSLCGDRISEIGYGISEGIASVKVIDLGRCKNCRYITDILIMIGDRDKFIG